MSPLILVTIGVILIATPLSIGASAFCWSLFREDRTNQLALVVALMATSTTVAGMLLAIPTVYFILGERSPLSGQLVLLAIDILLPANVLLAAYLRLLRR
jgi:hypothetical protein